MLWGDSELLELIFGLLGSVDCLNWLIVKKWKRKILSYFLIVLRLYLFCLVVVICEGYGLCFLLD